MDRLKERYPDIGFYLSFFPYEQVELEGDSAPVSRWADGLNLEEIEVVYVVGLLGHPLPIRLVKWLEEKQERALVFIESRLGAFAMFSDGEVLENPQIHLVYAQEDPIEGLAERFPVDKLAVYVPEGSDFDALQLERRSAAFSALYSDVLYSHLLVKNALINGMRLPECFEANRWKGAFQGVPAIICGAGPSLAKSISTLKGLGEKGLIIGCGSAITALSRAGVQPHLAVAFDPNEEEVERLKQSHFFAGPFLFGLRLHSDVFATTAGPFGYLKSDTGGWVEGYLEKKLGLEGEAIGPDLGSEAFSATTLAVSYAHFLGCSPVVFCGVDLAFSGGARYAGGVEAEPLCESDPRALEKRLERTGIDGQPVETLLKWVMESDAIGAYAKNHPETVFLNGASEGLGFDGVENVPLEQIFLGAKGSDLSGKVHALIETSRLQVEKQEVVELYEQLGQSLERCKELCLKIGKIYEENSRSGRLIVLEEDFRTEEGYLCFLEGIDLALEKILLRYFPDRDLDVAKHRRQLAKYRELFIQIERIGATLYRKRVCSSMSEC